MELQEQELDIGSEPMPTADEEADEECNYIAKESDEPTKTGNRL